VHYVHTTKSKDPPENESALSKTVLIYRQPVINLESGLQVKAQLDYYCINNKLSGSVEPQTASCTQTCALCTSVEVRPSPTPALLPCTPGPTRGTTHSRQPASGASTVGSNYANAAAAQPAQHQITVKNS